MNEKIINMLVTIHGREAEVLHWIMRRKPDVMVALYELWCKQQAVKQLEEPTFTRDIDQINEIIKINTDQGASKIKIIKMVRQMTGNGSKEAKEMVEVVQEKMIKEAFLRNAPISLKQAIEAH